MMKNVHLSGAMQSCLLVPVGQVHIGDAGAGRQQDVDSLQNNPFYPSLLLHFSTSECPAQAAR